MLEDFHLVAIVKHDEAVRLYHIPLHQGLQTTLSESWQMQLDAFMVDIQEIDFDAGYTPQDGDCFRLNHFEVPPWLNGQNSQTVVRLDSISRNENVMGTITGLAAFARNSQCEELILFQNFSRGHIVRPGRFLLLSGNTYETIQRPGLILSDRLSAIYSATDAKLLFHNFRVANTFLPLTEFYQEASDADIREVLRHERLAAEDMESSVAGANQWFRKHFAMVRKSGILDKYTARQIKAHARGYDVDVTVRDGRVVFPANKVAAKRLLQFLNEELFLGAITKKRYETNSKREAD